MSRDQVAHELGERIALGEALLERQIRSEEEDRQGWRDYTTWDEYNTTLLKKRFTSPVPASDYSYVGAQVYSFDETPAERLDRFHRSVRGRVRRLDSLREQLGLYEEAPGVAPAVLGHATASHAMGEEIFVVHGRADAARLAVADFLQKVMGQAPVILRDRPNMGQTIIEKLESESQGAGYAVVILTGDDEGRIEGGGAKALSPRARQNVVLELGYFIGRLGRGRVAVLYEEGVELPSDLHGLLHTTIGDTDAWKLELARELRAAGFEADLNKAI